MPKRILLTRRQLIHNSAALAVAGFAMPAYPQQLRRWTISNQRVSRTVVFKPDAGLYTEGFTDLATGARFVSPDNLRMDMATEFSFVVNGRTYPRAGFELLGADLPDGNSLTVRLRLREAGLEIHVSYLSYDGHPAIRKHLLLRNTGTISLKLTHLKEMGDFTQNDFVRGVAIPFSTPVEVLELRAIA